MNCIICSKEINEEYQHHEFDDELVDLIVVRKLTKTIGELEISEYKRSETISCAVCGHCISNKVKKMAIGHVIGISCFIPLILSIANLFPFNYLCKFLLCVGVIIELILLEFVSSDAFEMAKNKIENNYRDILRKDNYRSECMIFSSEGWERFSKKNKCSISPFI